MFNNISPDSVRSGRTCPANLGVRSCPVRKLICPVRLSPTVNVLIYILWIYLLRSRAIRLPNRMESWQRFFHNKRKQNIQDEMFCPWPSNSSVNKNKIKLSLEHIFTPHDASVLQSAGKPV